MNKHVLIALLLTSMTGAVFAGDPPTTAELQLAMHNGSHLKWLQPASLDKRTQTIAKTRLEIAVDELNHKLSKELEQKFAQQISEVYF